MLVLAWTCLITTAPTLATVRFVNASRPNDAGNGLSWQAARKSLQSALADAQYGDEIWVAAGTYRPSDTLDRSASFFLKNGVSIYGGFSGAETKLAQRDVAQHETVLSGDLAGNDAPPGSFDGAAENSYHVVVALNVDPTALIDGFTIAGGHADGPGLGAVPESQDQGAGLNVYFSSPMVVNCTIRGNWAKNHGAVNDHGDESTFLHCTFDRNYSFDFGAGLYIHEHSHTTAFGCIFTANESVNLGAGLYCRSEVSATINECTFSNNLSNNGAGMYADPDSVVVVMNSVFRENYATIGGGGLYADSSTAFISGCTFESNSGGLGQLGGGGGGGGSGGGGVWSTGGQPTIVACVFTTNHASFGAGIYNNEHAAPTISQCSFIENDASEGAGIYNLNSSGAVTDCQFTNNRVLGGSFPVGGGMSNYFANMDIDRCTFRHNTAEMGGGGLYIEGGTPAITRTRFLGNVATGTNEGWGGGILSIFATEPLISDCIFSGNQADVGGGFHNTVFSFPLIRSCSFSNNIATGRDGAFGGGLYNNQDSDVFLEDCIFWNDAPNELDGLPLSIRWSDVQGGANGDGIFDSNPLFLSPLGPDGQAGTLDDDLHIAPASPCVNAGDPLFVPAKGALDFDGQDRVSACRIDVGADERKIAQFPGDFNQDGVVSSADVASFAGALLYSDPLGACQADMNHDGVLNGADIQPFAAALTNP